MKNIKEFCKKHKKKILFTGCIVGAAIIGGVVRGKFVNKEVMDLSGGKCGITWKPVGTFMDLEKVKEILDLNANNSEMFAIIKENGTPNDYSCVLLSNEVILNK